MGLWVSRLLSIFGEKEARILVLGLDNAGKTTILCEWPLSLTHHHKVAHLQCLLYITVYHQIAQNKC